MDEARGKCVKLKKHWNNHIYSRSANRTGGIEGENRWNMKWETGEGKGKFGKTKN